MTQFACRAISRPVATEEGAAHHLALPLLFVVLYGSGFVGAKLGLPWAPPLAFLALRFAIAAAVVALIALAVRAPWPREPRQIAHILMAGALTVATFSIGVFVAIDRGLSPGLTALIIALQPILVALGARATLGEHLSGRQWLGLGLGLCGVGSVVSQRLDLSPDHMTGLGFAVLGLVGLTLGTLYQKRFCTGMNVYSGGALQSLSAMLVCLPFALLVEDRPVVWTADFAIALAYMSLGVSVGALSLLYVMIRRGEVSRVASVFYFVPVAAALVSVPLFGSSLDAAVVAGSLVTALGVVLVNRVPGRGRGRLRVVASR